MQQATDHSREAMPTPTPPQPEGQGAGEAELGLESPQAEPASNAEALAAAGHEPLPAGLQCSKHALCVKPEGHAHKCKKRVQLPERLKILEENRAAHSILYAAGDEGSSDEEIGPEEQRGISVPQEKLIQDMQSQINSMSSKFEQLLGQLQGLQLAGEGWAQPAAAPGHLAAPTTRQAAAGQGGTGQDYQKVALLSMFGRAEEAFAPAGAGHTTNASASKVPSLDTAVEQVSAALGTMSTASTAPIPTSGTPVGAAGPFAFGAGGLAGAGAHAGPAGVSVPLHAVLPEHVADIGVAGAFQQETTLQLSLGMQGTPIFTASQGMAAQHRKPRPAAELVRALPNFALYSAAAQRVREVLQRHGFSIEGYPTYQQRMLELALKFSHSDMYEWGQFLVLDQELRLLQHTLRLAWDFEQGRLDSQRHSMFLSMVAGRAAARSWQAESRQRFREGGGDPHEGELPPFQPEEAPAAGQEAGGSRPALRSSDCRQFWFKGTCAYGANCKFGTTHSCRLCGSAEHGTAKCDQ